MTRLIVIPELDALPETTYSYWTTADKIALVSYYGRKETRALCEYFGKSTNALQKVVYDLGLGISATDEEREEIIRQIEAGEK